MSVTTQAQEKIRLRSYLNPYIKGKVVDSTLSALATASAYLVNNVQAVNDSLYIVSAQQQYLDLRLADFGITRDPTIGLGDQAFREIGIQVKNRKQVRDLINNILDIIFGDEFCKATSNSQFLEPYALMDGDTLIVNFDGVAPTIITFYANQFTSIAAATAQEVANAISIGLSNLGVNGSAIVNNDGNGNYVQLLSNTIGASSSVTVLGGRAQNVLLFPSSVPAGGNASTQWTISLQNGGNLRFTWSGGADPGLGEVEPQQYVNIFGGGFSSSTNQGSFFIISSQGGVVNTAYFEINNPLGSTGIVTQGTNDAVMFFTPTRETILNKRYYAAVYQTEANILQIFMPATTQVIKRSRIGSAHLHGVSETPVLQYTFYAGTTFPSTGPAAYDIINNIGNANKYYTWYNISGGSNTDPMIPGFTGIEVTINSSDGPATVANKFYTAVATAAPALTLTIADNVVDIVFVNSSTVSDAGASTPNTLGPYVYDTSQGFTISNAETTLLQEVNGATSSVILVADSSGFPNSSGYIVINYGCQNQEVIPYIATPSNGSLLLSPAYFVQQDHAIGESVLLLASKAPIVLPSNGSAYEVFLTDTASGRVFSQELINNIAAAGVTVIYTILYPNDIGLGNWESAIPGTSEVAYVYGP